MKRKLKILPEALSDVQQSIDYYNQQQKGLGKSFSESTYKAIKKIAEMPQSASISHNDIRYKVMNDFPFIITYRYDDKIIHITRIFNTYLDSGKI